jgi:hypothetical protein
VNYLPEEIDEYEEISELRDDFESENDLNEGS